MNYVDRAFEEANESPLGGKVFNPETRRLSHPFDLKSRMKSLWAQKSPVLSAAAIGVILGISKNAVVGLRFRMKLPQRSKAGPRAFLPDGTRKVRISANPKAPYRREATPQAPRLECDAIQSLPPDHSDCAKPFMEIGPDECRYPVNQDGEPFMFCAASSREEGEPYCQRHHTLTHKYTPPKVNAWHGGRAAS